MSTMYEGSPPPMRGKVCSVQCNEQQTEDHPRLCGEKAAVNFFFRSFPGSPPPMRGKEFALVLKSMSNRITPAYAGKSLEHVRKRPARTGSPPPMRGKASHYTGGSIECRITPAYAGKSSIVSPSSAVDWDHPRLCGEKLEFTELVVHVTRITPAYAGKSRIPITQFLNIQDHPRLCGEKCTASAMSRIRSGSPPPMRGKDEFANGGRSKSGITPAYAGKRLKRS